jgi:hypothetical protein
MSHAAPTTSSRIGAPALAQRPAQTASVKCRLCECLLDAASQGRRPLGVCADCAKHPAVRELRPPREFTAVERGLIAKVAGYMPHEQLLAVLNERLAADLGPTAILHTLDQLRACLADLPPRAAGNDWAALRQVMARARRDGTLGAVTSQMIDDFAVLYSLAPAQVMRVKDIIDPSCEAGDQT